MCGRFVNNEKIPVQARRFAAIIGADTETWEPTYNATPGCRHPVVFQDGQRHLDLMSWGWKPDFGFLVNARGEETFGKKTFTEAIRERRCLVPATAFYEWTPRSRGQAGIPHAFRLTSELMFGIGGIWRTEMVAGQPVASFLLLTTEANPVVSPVHHRMALIIPTDQETAWLDPSTPIDVVRRLVVPFIAEPMSAFRVGPEIDRPGADGPQLLAPATGPTQQSLFE